MLTIFDYSDYKLFLKEYSESATGQWGLMSRLSKAAQCQRSHLSRVIKGSVHLTPDQAFAISEALHLGGLEGEYFVTLVNLARSSTQALRKHLESKLKDLKEKNDNLANRLGKPGVNFDKEFLQIYMSHWSWAAIHMMSSIPTINTSEEIAERLGLKLKKVEMILAKLKEIGFVTYHDGSWSYKTGAFHLEKGSPALIQHHQNWRMKAIEDAGDEYSAGVHFTTVLSLSRKDAERLKQRILDAIEEIQEVTLPSKEETLFCFNADFFEI